MQAIKSRRTFRLYVFLAIFVIFVLIIINNTVKEISVVHNIHDTLTNIRNKVYFSKILIDDADNDTDKERSVAYNQHEIDDNKRNGVGLSTDNNPEKTESKQEPSIVDANNENLDLTENNNKNQDGSINVKTIEGIDEQAPNDNREWRNIISNNENKLPHKTHPINIRMPSAYLIFHTPKSTTKDGASYCKFNYGLPKSFQPNNDVQFPPEQGTMSPYRVYYNVTEAHNVKNVSKVTYVTQVTANFAYYIPELLRRWTGLISVAAFVPGSDTALFLEQINNYCYCEPEMHRVSIHLVFPDEIPFPTNILKFTKPSECVPQDSSKLKVFKDTNGNKLYPINVARNVARAGSVTKYILVADAQLMPSKGLADGFLKFIKQYKPHSEKEVFTLPEFEVTDLTAIPETKKELIKLIKEKKAFYFYQFSCSFCHKIPNYKEWIGHVSEDNEIKAFKIAKREIPFNRWEPVYFSTNTEPLFPEKLSWNGLQDKMAQALEMCLQNYDFTILDNAYLVHWPGLQKVHLTEDPQRRKFIIINYNIFNELLASFKKKYAKREKCDLRNIQLKPLSKSKAKH